MGYVTIEKKNKYAIIWLAKEPVNLMGSELWAQLKAAFDEVEQDSKMQGVIFASGLKRDVFTAGNDINDLYAPKTSEQKYAKFWILSNHFLSQVYKSRLSTISAIKGACPAGGCALSICCDERVMTEKGHIGLNEVALGIPVPMYWARILANIVGYAKAEQMSLNASLLSPQQALACGLVNQVVSTEDLLPAAESRMQKILKLPADGRATTKQYFRAEFCKGWEAFAIDEPKASWQVLSGPQLIQTLEAYMKSLGGRKAKL